MGSRGDCTPQPVGLRLGKPTQLQEQFSWGGGSPSPEGWPAPAPRDSEMDFLFRLFKLLFPGKTNLRVKLLQKCQTPLRIPTFDCGWSSLNHSVAEIKRRNLGNLNLIYERELRPKLSDLN